MSKINGKNKSKQFKEGAQVANKRKEGKYEGTYFRLPPILTVDQLHTFRKKKSPVTLPKDNLCSAVGSFKHIKSEYRRRYKKIEDYLPQLRFSAKKTNVDPFLDLDDQRHFQTEYTDAYKSQRKEKEQESMVDENENKDSSRLFQKKKCNSLKLEGDFYHLTDYAENFIQYLIEKRTALQRRETTLKMLGDLNHDTENRDNFVPYDNVNAARPPLCKRFTNLHLSGSLHMDTENRDQFLPFKIDRQHQLSKLPTNLHLEGTLFLEPEYRSAFVEYFNFEKSKPVRPHNHLRSAVDFSDESISSDRVTKHPVIPYLRTYSPPNDNLLHENRFSSSRPVSRASSRPSSRSNFQQSSRPLSRSQSRSHSRSSSRPVSRSPSKSPSRFLSRPPSRSSSSIHQSTTDNGKEVDMNLLKGIKQDAQRAPVSRPADVKIKVPTRPVSLMGPEKRRKDVPARRHFITTLAPNMVQKVPYVFYDDDHDIPISSRRKSEAADTNYYANKIEPEHFDGRFECQPEYRKAYINYLIRERIENQPQLIQRSPPRLRQTESFSDNVSTSPILRVPSKKTIRKIDKLESKAFGPKCHSPLPQKESFSGTTSSEDFSTMQVKRSKIPRSKSFRTKTPTAVIERNTSDEYSSSEPAFVVM